MNQELRLALAYLSSLLMTVGTIPYVLDIFRGKTSPQRASWGIWSTLAVISFFSQLSAGAAESLWFIGAQVVGVGLVFILSFKFGTGGFSKLDSTCLGGAALGLVLWFFTGDPMIALYLVILVDFFGNIPTIKKGFEEPQSETIACFALSGLSGLAGALSVEGFAWHLVLYPLYILLANTTIVSSILLGRLNIKRE